MLFLKAIVIAVLGFSAGTLAQMPKGMPKGGMPGKGAGMPGGAGGMPKGFPPKGGAGGAGGFPGGGLGGAGGAPGGLGGLGGAKSPGSSDSSSSSDSGSMPKGMAGHAHGGRRRVV